MIQLTEADMAAIVPTYCGGAMVCEYFIAVVQYSAEIQKFSKIKP